MRMMLKSVGLVSLIRLRETSLEALQFCCSIRIAGVACSVMGQRGGGGSYDVETKGGRLGVRERGGRVRVRGRGRLAVLSGTCAKGVSKGKWGMRLITPGAIGDTSGLSCECGFGGRAAADPAGVITLAVSAHGGFYAAALTVGAGVLVGAFVLSCGVGACATAAAVPPRAFHRPMPPVLASEALRWPRNVDADAARNPSDSDVVVYSCVSCIFGFEAYH